MQNIESIYHQHKDLFFNYLYRHLGNEHDAYDVLQEVFLRLLKNLKKIQKGKEKSWMFTVARNLIFEKWKHKKRNHYFQEKESTDENTNFNQYEQIDDFDLFSEIAKKEELDCLDKQIDKLSPIQKDILFMKYKSELKIQEIAQITKLTAENIKTTLHRARNKLKYFFKEHCHGQ